MLDIKFIRENKDLIKEGARKKHIEFDVDALMVADEKRREMLGSIEEKKAKQNAVSEQIMREADASAKQKMIDEMRAIKFSREEEEEKFKDVIKEWQMLMLQVPNVPDISVPEGSSDEENKEIRKWGDIPQFLFAPKSHIELMQAHGMVDFERGTKVAGFRGYFLKNKGALLEFAIIQCALNHFGSKGQSPMIVPSLVKKETLLGTGYLPQGEDDLYKTQDDDYLAGTGEVSSMSYYSDEVIDKEKLPLKMLALSPCFRREAGSHGKDTKGLIRVHEFYKAEQLILCEANHETSVALHEELTANAEEFMQLLGIPYRLVVNCGGDLGLGQVKKYDIEAWVPTENKYRETHSSSYFHDFQARRLNIKYRDSDGKLKFVHSLNNTAVAFPRILVPLIENNQQADGSIRIPEILRPYLGGMEFITLA